MTIPVGLPRKPYVYRGPERDLDPEIRAQVYDTDPNGVGYEWRREQLAEHVEPPQPPAPVAPPATEPKPRCDRCGYLVIRCDCPGGPTC